MALPVVMQYLAFCAINSRQYVFHSLGLTGMGTFSLTELGQWRFNKTPSFITARR